jgi:SAM-dependent methyltransferase
VSRRYDAAAYWEERLERDFDLRGTGHHSYSLAYNRWLYRAKARALERALCGVPADARALDVGCGTGWVVGRLLERGHEVEGCDIAAVAVERLARMEPRARFFETALGAEPLPRPDGSFGLVTALDVLYHLPDDTEFEHAVRDLARVLEPAGTLVVTDGLGERDRDPAAHVRFRSRPRWEAAARAAGLRGVASGPLYRWLSRDPDGGLLARLPDGVRGAIEYALDLVAPRTSHMHWAVFARDADMIPRP